MKKLIGLTPKDLTFYNKRESNKDSLEGQKIKENALSIFKTNKSNCNSIMKINFKKKIIIGDIQNRLEKNKHSTSTYILK